jgi:TonB family protein
MITSLLILLFVSGISTATGAQDPNQQLRDWAGAGQIKAIQKIMAGGELNVDSRDSDGWTALMYAAKGGHDDIVQLLLDAGATVDIENNVKETALHLAATYGRAEAVRLLLDADSDFTAVDASSRTPLYWAIERKHAEVIELLQAAANRRSDRVRVMEDPAAKGITTPPRIVEKQRVEYTDTARELGIEGTVVLTVLVRRDGTVGGISVSESLEESLDRRAMDAVRRKWKFEPASREGKAVNVVVEIEIEFLLPPKQTKSLQI